MILCQNQKMMTRGGKRPGAGVKPTWKNGKTKTIRVPIAIAGQVLGLARELDEKGFIECDTVSKMVNLSGVAVSQLKGKTFVFLQDLIKEGYEIKPEKLADRVIDEIYKDQLAKNKA